MQNVSLYLTVLREIFVKHPMCNVAGWYLERVNLIALGVARSVELYKAALRHIGAV